MTLVSINSTVAYFSMEICLEQAIPTYSGGLGVLAGDTLRSAADLGVPVVVFTTHTPVPAGHDKFPIDMVRHVLGSDQVALLEAAQCVDEGTLNLTHVA